MKWIFAWALAMVIAWWISLPNAFSIEQQEGVVTLRKSEKRLDSDLPRYGLNLGGTGTWGAEHLRNNILANPGFEPVLDRTLLVVAEVSRGKMSDDTSWLARPEGFWDAATFEVKTGLRSGEQGKILHSGQNAAGAMQLVTNHSLEGLASGEIVALTRHSDWAGAPMWWRNGGKVTTSNNIRPGSPGRQAVRLSATASERAELLHYFDTITERAGKLMLVNGQWRLAVWARAEQAAVPLRMYFGRAGVRPFLEQNCLLDKAWRLCEFVFDAKDNGPEGVVTLGLSVTNASVILDDAFLGEAQSGVGGFRREVVQTLKQLRPGYLRDWQGQLGDTQANRVAGELAHQPIRYRPGESEIQYHYGLDDFFLLCAEVGARPWIVAPTTFSDQEWKAFGAYLSVAANRHRFDEIHVEFGNENWNIMFRPAGIQDIKRHAELSDRAFRLLKQGSLGDKRLFPVVNAQFVNPDNPKEIAAASKEAIRVAVAPYMLNQLDQTDNRQAAHQQAFREGLQPLQQEVGDVGKYHKRLSVYEVNFHTTWGNAKTDLRNEVVTGAASGPALAQRLLKVTLAGVREQAVYQFSGFDSYLSEDKTLVRLWGITRDLNRAEHFRPTGIALSLLNSVAGGKSTASQCVGLGCEEFTAVVFQDGLAWAIVSASKVSREIMLDYPCPNGRISIRMLDGSAPSLNNENQLDVRTVNIEHACSAGLTKIVIPAQSLVVIGSKKRV